MGGYVHFASRGVKTDEPIFGHVDELVSPAIGSVRVVRAGSALDTALRDRIKCVGGDPIIVKACKDAQEFTVEYKTGYGTAPVGNAASDDDDDEESDDDE